MASARPVPEMLKNALDAINGSKGPWVCLHAIEEALADKDSIKYLKSSEGAGFKEYLNNNYKRMIEMAVDELRAISHYLIAGIPDEDLISREIIGPKKPKGFEALNQAEMALKNKIIDEIVSASNPYKRAIVAERWIAIMQACFVTGDIPSMVAIYNAFASSEMDKLLLPTKEGKQPALILSEKAIKILDLLGTTSQHGKKEAFIAQKEVAERIMSNRTDSVIPAIWPFAELLTAEDEKLKKAKNDVKEIKVKIKARILEDKEVIKSSKEYQNKKAELEKLEKKRDEIEAARQQLNTELSELVKAGKKDGNSEYDAKRREKDEKSEEFQKINKDIVPATSALKDIISNLWEEFYSALGDAEKSEIDKELEAAAEDKTAQIKKTSEQIKALESILKKMKNNLGRATSISSFSEFQNKIIFPVIYPEFAEEKKQQIAAIQAIKLSERKKAAGRAGVVLPEISESVLLMEAIRERLTRLDKIVNETALGTIFTKVKEGKNNDEKAIKKFITDILQEIDRLKASHSYADIIEYINIKLKESPTLIDPDYGYDVSDIKVALNILKGIASDLAEMFDEMRKQHPIPKLETKDLPRVTSTKPEAAPRKRKDATSKKSAQDPKDAGLRWLLKEYMKMGGGEKAIISELTNDPVRKKIVNIIAGFITPAGLDGFRMVKPELVDKLIALGINRKEIDILEKILKDSNFDHALFIQHHYEAKSVEFDTVIASLKARVKDPESPLPTPDTEEAKAPSIAAAKPSWAPAATSVETLVSKRRSFLQRKFTQTGIKTESPAAVPQWQQPLLPTQRPIAPTLLLRAVANLQRTISLDDVLTSTIPESPRDKEAREELQTQLKDIPLDEIQDLARLLSRSVIIDEETGESEIINKAAIEQIAGVKLDTPTVDEDEFILDETFSQQSIASTFEQSVHLKLALLKLEALHTFFTDKATLRKRIEEHKASLEFIDIGVPESQINSAIESANKFCEQYKLDIIKLDQLTNPSEIRAMKLWHVARIIEHLEKSFISADDKIQWLSKETDFQLEKNKSMSATAAISPSLKAAVSSFDEFLMYLKNKEQASIDPTKEYEKFISFYYSVLWLDAQLPIPEAKPEPEIEPEAEPKVEGSAAHATEPSREPETTTIEIKKATLPPPRTKSLTEFEKLRPNLLSYLKSDKPDQNFRHDQLASQFATLFTFDSEKKYHLISESALKYLQRASTPNVPLKLEKLLYLASDPNIRDYLSVNHNIDLTRKETWESFVQLLKGLGYSRDITLPRPPQLAAPLSTETIKSTDPFTTSRFFNKSKAPKKNISTISSRKEESTKERKDRRSPYATQQSSLKEATQSVLQLIGELEDSYTFSPVNLPVLKGAKFNPAAQIDLIGEIVIVASERYSDFALSLFSVYDKLHKDALSAIGNPEAIENVKKALDQFLVDIYVDSLHFNPAKLFLIKINAIHSAFELPSSEQAKAQIARAKMPQTRLARRVEENIVNFKEQHKPRIGGLFNPELTAKYESLVGLSEPQQPTPTPASTAEPTAPAAPTGWTTASPTPTVPPTAAPTAPPTAAHPTTDPGPPSTPPTAAPAAAGVHRSPEPPLPTGGVPVEPTTPTLPDKPKEPTISTEPMPAVLQESLNRLFDRTDRMVTKVEEMNQTVDKIREVIRKLKNT